MRRCEAGRSRCAVEFDKTAQRGPAAGFDGPHNSTLTAAQMAHMGLTVSGTVAAEDIRHLRAPRMPSLRRAVSPEMRSDREGRAGVPAVTWSQPGYRSPSSPAPAPEPWLPYAAANLSGRPMDMWTIGFVDRLRFPRFPSKLGRRGNARFRPYTHRRHSQ